jgi:RNA polymerase sigma factor (sigma-70 family)
VVASGDDQLRALVTRYARLIRSVVARVSGRRDADLGDEVLQRVSASLWTQVKAEQTIDHPTSYIYRCAVRETVRLISRELEERRVPLDTPASRIIAASGPDPEAGARATELAEAVEGVLQGLRPDRAAAVRAHLEGLEVEEIMRLYRWTYGRARNLIARGMADLRDALRRRGLA